MSTAPPTDAETLRRERIFEQRAQKLSRAPEAAIQRRILSDVALVALGEVQLGLPVDSLLEIVLCPPVARLPGLPLMVAGLVQHRGALMTAINLRHWMSLPGASIGRYLAVLQGEGGSLGLCVDAVVGFRALYEDELTQHYTGGTVDRGLPILGVTRDLITIVDGGRLLEMPLTGAQPAERVSNEGPSPPRVGR